MKKLCTVITLILSCALGGAMVPAPFPGFRELIRDSDAIGVFRIKGAQIPLYSGSFHHVVSAECLYPLKGELQEEQLYLLLLWGSDFYLRSFQSGEEYLFFLKDIPDAVELNTGAKANEVVDFWRGGTNGSAFPVRSFFVDSNRDQLNELTSAEVIKLVLSDYATVLQDLVDERNSELTKHLDALKAPREADESEDSKRNADEPDP